MSRELDNKIEIYLLYAILCSIAIMNFDAFTVFFSMELENVKPGAGIQLKVDVSGLSIPMLLFPVTRESFPFANQVHQGVKTARW